jgi:hypothetical protein
MCDLMLGSAAIPQNSSEVSLQRNSSDEALPRSESSQLLEHKVNNISNSMSA